MKRQHILIMVFAVVVIMILGAVMITSSGRNGTGEGEGNQVEAEWTTLMWMCSEGDLGEWNMGLCNLHFLEMVPDNPSMNVIIILDKEEEGDTKLIELHQGGSTYLNLTDINPEWGNNELNTGDGPATPIPELGSG